MGKIVLQAMDLTSLRAVLSELREVLLPSRFETAQQPEANTLQLGFRTLKGLVWLELSWRADCARIVQIPHPAKQGDKSTLARQLQHGLHHLALTEIKQKGFDRVVEFCLSNRPGSPIQRSLILEIMGRHSNFLLLDNQRYVITLGRQIRIHQSRIRPISTGDKYIPPPVMEGIEPCKQEPFKIWKERLCFFPESFRSALQTNYQGISPTLAMQIASNDTSTAKNLLSTPVNDISKEQWKKLYKRWIIWLEKIEEEDFCLKFEGPTSYRVWDESLNEYGASKKGLSIKLGEYYRNKLDEKLISQTKKQIRQLIRNKEQQETAAIKDHEDHLKHTHSYNKLKDKADTILCARSPSKANIQEAQKLYKQVKKMRRSKTIIQERIAHHNKRLEIIHGSETFLESLSTNDWEKQSERLQRLLELFEELKEILNPNCQTKKTDTHNKYHNRKILETKTSSGLLIQIGRNHRQNDSISLKHARPGDIWFHAQECPGSHVVLKASSGLAEDGDFQLAADLAAYFSRAKGNQKVPIVMVPANQLQRIPGENLGSVRYRGGTICWGNPDKGLKHISPD